MAELEQFIDYARKKFGQNPQLVFVGQGIDAEAKIFSKQRIIAKSFDLDPLCGVSLRKTLPAKIAKL